MQEGLKVAISKTGTQPLPGESIEKYLNRAAASTYGKIK
jgi:hypothetical protein